MAKARTWEIWVKVIDWHDGDSAHCVVDFSCHNFMGSDDHPVMIRAARINAPELSTGKPGTDARDYAASIAPPGLYQATSVGEDLHGRPIVDLHLPGGSLFSDRMLAAGQAARYL